MYDSMNFTGLCVCVGLGGGCVSKMQMLHIVIKFTGNLDCAGTVGVKDNGTTQIYCR